MNPAQRQKTLALAAGIALAVLVGDSLVRIPLTKAWKDRSARLVTLRKNVTQGTTLLDRESTIRERWSGMRTNMLVRETSLAESQVLQTFDRCSQDSGVSISAIRPQWKRGNDDFFTLECRADAAGSLANLTRFLFLLERDPLALRIESLELTTRDPEGQQLSLGIQVSALQLQQPGS